MAGDESLHGSVGYQLARVYLGNISSDRCGYQGRLLAGVSSTCDETKVGRLDPNDLTRWRDGWDAGGECVREREKLRKEEGCSRQLTDADEGVPLPFSSVADADEWKSSPPCPPLGSFQFITGAAHLPQFLFLLFSLLNFCSEGRISAGDLRFMMLLSTSASSAGIKIDSCLSDPGCLGWGKTLSRHPLWWTQVHNTCLHLKIVL